MEIKCQLDATEVLHLVGILFPHINDDARSKSHQIRERERLRSIGSDQKEKKGRPRRASGDSLPQQF